MTTIDRASRTQSRQEKETRARKRCSIRKNRISASQLRTAFRGFRNRECSLRIGRCLRIGENVKLKLNAFRQQFRMISRNKAALVDKLVCKRQPRSQGLSLPAPNLVPRVSLSPPPRAREERPWLGLVTCLLDK